MNKRLLILGFSLFASLAAMAQWTKPVPAQFESLKATEAEGDTTFYYLYNKEAGLFYTQGNAWGTEASVGRNPLKLFFYSEIADDDTELIIRNWAVKSNKWSWHTLFIDNPTSCFVDRASQANYHWYWTDMGDNTYRFYGSALNPDFNQTNYPDCYFGYDKYEGASETSRVNSVLNINEVPEGHTYCVDWKLVSPETFAAIEAQYNSYITANSYKIRLDRAEEVGEIGMSRFAPIYSNAETTIQEFDSMLVILNAAIALKERVNVATENNQAINLSRYTPYYSGTTATTAEMDSVRAILNAAISFDDYLNQVSTDYGVDVSEGKALVAKADYLVADIDSLKAAMAPVVQAAQVKTILADASEENPKDATSLLANPSLSSDASGWKATFVANSTANNIGRQTASYTNGEVTIGNFYEAWSNGNYNPNVNHRALGNGELIYTIAIPNLPKGKYRLEADVCASYQDSDLRDDVEGAYLFSRNGTQESLTPVMTHNKMPEHFEHPFLFLEGDTILVGIKTINTNANWVGIDNLKLYYLGALDGDPDYIALQAHIEKYEQTYPVLEDIHANAEKKSAYETALDNAKEATSDFKAASAALIQAADTLAASIEDYNVLKAAMTRCESEQARFENTAWDGLSQNFGDLYMSLETGYDDGTAEEELQNLQMGDATISTTIAELTALMDQMIVDYITENVKPGEEITLLLKNPSFDKDVTGWTKVSGNTPVWGGRKGSQGTNQAIDYSKTTIGEDTVYYRNMDLVGGCAEVFRAKFDIQQVVKNLPKGSYTLTIQALARHNKVVDPTPDFLYVDDYAKGPEEGITAVLYCNEFEKKVSNILASAQQHPVFGYNGNGQTFYYNPDDVTTYTKGDFFGDTYVEGYGFIPCGMEGANYHFNIDKHNYENKIDFVLTEDGQDITIGLRNTGTDSWILFDNFRLYYNGTGKPIYKETVDELVAKLTAATEKERIGNDAKDAAIKAIAAVTDAFENDEKSEDELLAEMSNASKTLNYATESADIYNQLNTLAENGILAEAMETYATTARAVALDEAEVVLNDIESTLETMDKTVDEVKALINAHDAAIKELKIPDYTNATAEAPVEFTNAFIVNGTFDTVSDFTGWSGTAFGAGGNTSTNAEHYQKGFDTYQDITNLPKGYYVATVQGYYRHGSSANDWTLYQAEDKSGHRQTYFYAASDVDTMQTVVQYHATGAIPAGTAWVVDNTEAVGDGLIVPTSMKAATAWFDQAAETPATPYTPNQFYNNLVQVYVGEGGTLRIGVKKSGNDTADWAIFDNFKLWYIGTEPDPYFGDASAIAEVENAVAVKVQGIYNLQGQKLAAPQKGLNIIGGRKVLVK